MDTTNQLITYHSNDWMNILLAFLFLVGLYFLQKYLHVLEWKLFAGRDDKKNEKQKPWPLYMAVLMGLSVFLYNVFSPVKLTVCLTDFPAFAWLVFAVTFVVVIGLVFQSISIFGIQKGMLRSLVYLVLMGVYFYAGFVLGMLVVVLLAILILGFFFKYFKNILTIQ